MRVSILTTLMIPLFVSFLLFGSGNLYAVDPRDDLDSSFFSDIEDNNKTATELLEEATKLLADERPLDARTKLLKALEKDPKNYRAHMLIGGYYMVHVGHYRLALQYLKQARSLFESENGLPPYDDYVFKDDHARILYLISETRLNLDNYQGALQALDEYSQYYYGSWYPGSRAWVLMKLGRVDEAVKIARLGILTGAEPGRTLNILGILLSMTGQRENSIRVFEEAITYEYALGETGQPATPLNNSGEVFREIFDEERAEGSWLRAIALPDGCEHVLPSLNLAGLYIEQLRFDRAKWAMDNFEQCITQYPLRNGEEHRALVHMARGRIDLHTGHNDEALKQLESASERRQWFGKIGTNADDLRAATLISLAQGLRARNNILKTKIDPPIGEWLSDRKEIISNQIRSWWLFRRARQILAEDLSDFEDLYVRNTDSMIEYHTLGDALTGIPTKTLKEKIKKEEEADNRTNAHTYYKAYLAQNYLARWQRSEGLKVLDEALKNTRQGPDDGLRLHLILLKLSNIDENTSQYTTLSEKAYEMAPAELRNWGLKLAVKDSLSPPLKAMLGKTLFLSSDATESKAQFELSGFEKNGEYVLSFTAPALGIKKKAKGATVKEALSAITNIVFREEL